MDQNNKVTVRQENKEAISMDCREQETLLEAFIRHGLLCRADCGGRGTCGKCRIKVSDGALRITIQDRKVFSKDELEEGYRLACRAIPEKDLSITLCNPPEEQMKAVTENCKEANHEKSILKHGENQEEYCIGIDLGTTTIAFRLSDLQNRAALSTHTLVNPQRIYGTDVISRIKASVDGKKKELQSVIQDALFQGIQEVIIKAGVQPEAVTQLVIAGNTTMIHLLLGYSCETLGVYPFTPVNKNTHQLSFEELFAGYEAAFNHSDNGRTGSRELLNRTKEVPVIILPGISAFVGGDIVAGLAVCGFHTSDTISLLIDFGTNGELALGNKDRILVASAAAGPAFEGGNISCGVGSIPGAISHFSLEGDHCSYETIDAQAPTGICGTGVIELISELLRNGIIDETGLLCEQYFTTGYPVKYLGETVLSFQQKDIRELQLAKAAVRAGLEVLLKNYGITYDQVDRVYLAGGFGFYLDVGRAVRIGLLPKEFGDKVFTIGNSSLAGAEQAAFNRETIAFLEKLAEKAVEIPLSLDPDFNDLYLEHMSF